MHKTAKGVLAAVPERDFLLASEVVTGDREQRGGEGSMERAIGVLCDHFPRMSGIPARVVVRMQALITILDHPLMRA